MICLQETKAKPDQLEAALREPAGWHSFWHSADKPGYSSVAIISKVKPDDKGDLKATVHHNGVKVHDAYPIARKGAKPAGILLQDHGNAVVYRNIWMVPDAK